MKLLRSAFVVGTLLASSLVAGCGSSDSEPADTNHAAAEAKAMLDPVAKAIANPTGTVDANSAKLVLQSSKAQSAASAASGYVPGASTPGSQPMNANPQQCITQSGAYSASIDMGCISDGAVTGKVTYDLGQEGGGTYFVFSYDDVCSKDANGAESCIDGKGAESIGGNIQAGESEITVAGDFDVTANGATEHVHYGYKMTTKNGTTTIEYAAFDSNGNSYVLSASVNGDTGTITIKGKNGEFTCSYSNGGETGSCEGAESFTW